MSWLKTIFLVYLLANLLLFLKAKSENPENPAGFIGPKVMQQLQLQQKQKPLQTMS